MSLQLKVSTNSLQAIPEKMRYSIVPNSCKKDEIARNPPHRYTKSVQINLTVQTATKKSYFLVHRPYSSRSEKVVLHAKRLNRRSNESHEFPPVSSLAKLTGWVTMNAIVKIIVVNI